MSSQPAKISEMAKKMYRRLTFDRNSSNDAEEDRFEWNVSCSQGSGDTCEIMVDKRAELERTVQQYFLSFTSTITVVIRWIKQNVGNISYLRARRCLVRWATRVNLWSQSGHDFVCGKIWTFVLVGPVGVVWPSVEDPETGMIWGGRMEKEFIVQTNLELVFKENKLISLGYSLHAEDWSPENNGNRLKTIQNWNPVGHDACSRSITIVDWQREVSATPREPL